MSVLTCHRDIIFFCRLGLLKTQCLTAFSCFFLTDPSLTNKKGSYPDLEEHKLTGWEVGEEVCGSEEEEEINKTSQLSGGKVYMKSKEKT